MDDQSTECSQALVHSAQSINACLKRLDHSATKVAIVCLLWSSITLGRGRVVERKDCSVWLEDTKVDEPCSGVELRVEILDTELVWVALLSWHNIDDCIADDRLCVVSDDQLKVCYYYSQWMRPHELGHWQSETSTSEERHGDSRRRC